VKGHWEQLLKKITSLSRDKMETRFIEKFKRSVFTEETQEDLVFLEGGPVL
jgi:hypothetical protein